MLLEGFLGFFLWVKEVRNKNEINRKRSSHQQKSYTLSPFNSFVSSVCSVSTMADLQSGHIKPLRMGDIHKWSVCWFEEFFLGSTQQVLPDWA